MEIGGQVRWSFERAESGADAPISRHTPAHRLVCSRREDRREDARRRRRCKERSSREERRKRRVGEGGR
eukprot:3224390-Rhodomonas_salina.1